MVLRDGLAIVARFVRRRRGAFLVAMLGSTLFAGAIIMSSVVVGWITDSAVLPVLQEGRSTRGKIWPVVLAVLGVATWKATAIILRRTGAAWLQFKTQQDVRAQVVAHELELELGWFGRRSVGDLIAVADNDTRRGTGVLSPLPYAAGVSLLIAGTVVLLTLLDPWLGLTALVGMSIVVVVEVRAAVRLYPAWEGVQSQVGAVSAAAHEAFDGALTVKALGREEYVTARMRAESNELRDRTAHLGTSWETYRLIIVSLIPTVSLAILVVGAFRIDAGAITAGDVVTALYLLSLQAFPIQLIAFVLFEMAAAIPSWRRVAAVLDADEIVAYGAEEADVGAGAAPVRSRYLTFGYDSGAPVLADVSVDVPAGRTVAVVGPTGSGKSTLVALMARLWDPRTGRILVDGRDVRDFARSELPREVAFVAQTAFLFDATVRDNVALGLDAGDDEIHRALQLAGAAGFVADLPHGIDTRVGERGASLSGGQRQRIALARALVRSPRVLILDDATSAVDPSVEGAILHGLRSADLPSTIVIVAHRPSSIRLADEVIYVEDGRVVAHGAHETLMGREAGYARLVAAYEADAAARPGGT